MQSKTVIKWGLIGGSVCALLACGPFANRSSNSAPAAQPTVMESATTSGAGDRDELSANHDQVGLPQANQSYYFEFNKSEIQSDARPSLKVQAQYLVARPDVKVLLAGHTDERGSREYNIALGQRRALSVATLLQALGVAKNQITTVSYGAEKPLALGHREADFAKNRRVDLIYQTTSSIEIH